MEICKGKIPQGSKDMLLLLGGRGGGAERGVSSTPSPQTPTLCADVLSPFALAFLSSLDICGISQLQGEVSKEVPRPG